MRKIHLGNPHLSMGRSGINFNFSTDVGWRLVRSRKEFNRRVMKVKKSDYIFIGLDSCRYDTFEAADAPHMKSIGKLRRVNSFACFTLS